MESTVQPDRKLIVATGKSPVASSTGLTITPPPIPQIAPIVDAKKQITNTAMCVIDMNTPQFLYPIESERGSCALPPRQFIRHSRRAVYRRSTTLSLRTPQTGTASSPGRRTFLPQRTMSGTRGLPSYDSTLRNYLLAVVHFKVLGGSIERRMRTHETRHENEGARAIARLQEADGLVNHPAQRRFSQSSAYPKTAS